jgi:hypothetical protein
MAVLWAGRVGWSADVPCPRAAMHVHAWFCHVPIVTWAIRRMPGQEGRAESGSQAHFALLHEILFACSTSCSTSHFPACWDRIPCIRTNYLYCEWLIVVGRDRFLRWGVHVHVPTCMYNESMMIHRRTCGLTHLRAAASASISISIYFYT